MTRFILLFALFFSLFLFAVSTIARARPLTQGDFLPLITRSDECDAICPLNIAVGVMGPSQAIRMLERTGWVGEIVVTRGMELDSGYIQWTWNGAQPVYIDTARQGSIWFQHGIVQRIEIVTHIPFGELWLHTDAPQTGRIHSMSVTPPRVYQMMTFERGILIGRTEIPCPLRLAAYWYAPVILRVNSPYSAAAALLLEPDPFELPGVGGCGAG